MEARGDGMTRGLARALGKRRVRVADFDLVLVEERMEESLRRFVEVACERTTSVRERILLRVARDFEGSLSEAFGGEVAADEVSLRRPLRGGDEVFYERAVAALSGRSRRRIGLRCWRQDGATPEPVFVFNHLPKSYGTSLRQFFGRVFGGVEDPTEFLGGAGVVDDAPVDLRRLAADTLVCGHFTHGAFLLQRRYPEIWADAERFRLFTFVRDPLATAVSNFHHVRRHDAAAVAREPELYASLENYLGALENPIAMRLGCDAGSLNAVLGRYFFIGAAEHHGAGLGVLLERMGAILDEAASSATVERARAAVEWLAGQPLEHANAGVDGDVGVSAEVREKFRRRNALDYDIYERALGGNGGLSSGGVVGDNARPQ